MDDTQAIFEEMKSFLDFGDEDIVNLRALAPVFATHGPSITDRFYETLGRYPSTASFIAGRVDSLKGTHGEWMRSLFAGEYGAAYLERRLRIGQIHVKIGLPPYYVEAVMNAIRIGGHDAIVREIHEPARVDALYASLVKILDLDLLLINLAYADERLNRMTKVTGMSRKLVERLINAGDKKP